MSKLFLVQLQIGSWMQHLTYMAFISLAQCCGGKRPFQPSVMPANNFTSVLVSLPDQYCGLWWKRVSTILSPIFFNIVMNPLLRTLETSGVGLSVNNLYSGAYLHADDIRTLATSMSSLQPQISQVLDFISNSFFLLNPTKCEIVSFAQCNNIDNPVCEIVLTASGTAKCLGYLWNHDLSAKVSSWFVYSSFVHILPFCLLQFHLLMFRLLNFSAFSL